MQPLKWTIKVKLLFISTKVFILIEGEEYLKYSKSDALLIAQKRTVHMHAERRTTVLYFRKLVRN